MSEARIQDGNYHLSPTKGIVSESQKGNLMVVLFFDVNGIELRGYNVLAKADGSINERTLYKLRQCFPGWDGTDPFWFMDNDISGYTVEVVVENETNEDGTFARVKWINPIGGGGGGASLEVADRRSVMTQFGNKLKTLAGGTPIRPQAAPQAAVPKEGEHIPPTPKVAPMRPQAAPPARPAPDMNSAWARLVEMTPKMNNANREAVWFNLTDQYGGVAAITDWAAVIADIESNYDDLPF